MFKRVRSDIKAVFDRDPAAKNIFEVLLCYPGLHAVWAHRITHRLYKRRCFVLARIISQVARFFTGIEIHPGATIGEGLFIDHGSGVVIGETAELGDYVTIFQGVTLGGTGKEKGKRHPTIGDHVIVSAGAKILGSFTVGNHAKIGAGAVVLHPVPPNSTVVGVPGRVVVQDGVRVGHELDHADMPDPVAKMFQCMQHKIFMLEQRLESMEESTAEGQGSRPHQPPLTQRTT